MALQESQEQPSPESEPRLDSFVELVNNVNEGNQIEISENVEYEIEYFVMDVENDSSVNLDNSNIFVSSFELL